MCDRRVGGERTDVETWGTRRSYSDLLSNEAGLVGWAATPSRRGPHSSMGNATPQRAPPRARQSRWFAGHQGWSGRCGLWAWCRGAGDGDVGESTDPLLSAAAPPARVHGHTASTSSHSVPNCARASAEVSLLVSEAVGVVEDRPPARGCCTSVLYEGFASLGQGAEVDSSISFRPDRKAKPGQQRFFRERIWVLFHIAPTLNEKLAHSPHKFGKMVDIHYLDQNGVIREPRPGSQQVTINCLDSYVSIGCKLTCEQRAGGNDCWERLICRHDCRRSLVPAPSCPVEE